MGRRNGRNSVTNGARAKWFSPGFRRSWFVDEVDKGAGGGGTDDDDEGGGVEEVKATDDDDEGRGVEEVKDKNDDDDDDVDDDTDQAMVDVDDHDTGGVDKGNAVKTHPDSKWCDEFLTGHTIDVTRTTAPRGSGGDSPYIEGNLTTDMPEAVVSLLRRGGVMNDSIKTFALLFDASCLYHAVGSLLSSTQPCGDAPEYEALMDLLRRVDDPECLLPNEESFPVDVEVCVCVCVCVTRAVTALPCV